MSVLAALVLGAAAAFSPHPAVRPRPAPAAFASPKYGLRFRVPPRSSYCPLPSDWVGADHGTVIFLTPPRACAGTGGFPSSSRGFRPGDVPRIEVFYAYWLDEEQARPAPCGPPIRFAGRLTTICRGRRGRQVTLTVTARYRVEPQEDGKAILSLVTTPTRERHDARAFRRLIASARTCSDAWRFTDRDGRAQGRSGVTGVGPRCPADARRF